MTKQPEWKFVANLGDVHPIDYGGYFVYEDQTGVYAPEAEKLFAEEDPDVWTVYRIVLDRCQLVIDANRRHYLVPHGFADRTDLPHPIESYEEWFCDHLPGVAASTGLSVIDLEQYFCDPNPCRRALAYQTVADTEGWENFDEYPLHFKDRAEVEARYPKEVHK